MSTPDSDMIGTVREGSPREPGTVLVKSRHGIWMVLGGTRSGCHTFPSSAIVASEHPVIGMVPGLAPADFVTAAAQAAADRFAGRTA